MASIRVSAPQAKSSNRAWLSAAWSCEAPCLVHLSTLRYRTPSSKFTLTSPCICCSPDLTLDGDETTWQTSKATVDTSVRSDDSDDNSEPQPAAHARARLQSRSPWRPTATSSTAAASTLPPPVSFHSAPLRSRARTAVRLCGRTKPHLALRRVHFARAAKADRPKSSTGKRRRSRPASPLSASGPTGKWPTAFRHQPLHFVDGRLSADTLLPPHLSFRSPGSLTACSPSRRRCTHSLALPSAATMFTRR